MEYCIVKNASDEVWGRWFIGDPNRGVHISFSAADTPTGRALSIKTKYADKQEAEIDLKRMQEQNHSGYYAVCPVL